MYTCEQNGILKFKKAHVCPQQFLKNQLTPVEPLKYHEICMFLTLQIMGHIPKNQSDIPITLFALCCFKRCDVQSLLQNWGLDQPPNSLMGFKCELGHHRLAFHYIISPQHELSHHTLVPFQLGGNLNHSCPWSSRSNSLRISH